MLHFLHRLELLKYDKIIDGSLAAYEFSQLPVVPRAFAFVDRIVGEHFVKEDMSFLK